MVGLVAPVALVEVESRVIRVWLVLPELQIPEQLLRTTV